MTTQRIYPRLLRYTWRYKAWLGLAVLGMVGYSGADVLLVYLIKPLLDGSIVDRDPFLITWMPLFLLLLFVWRGVAGFVSRYSMAWVSKHVVFDVRNDMFGRYLTLPSSFFANNSTGSTTAKLTYYTGRVAGAATSAATTVIQDSVRLVGFLGLMFFMNWSLTLITLAVAPAVAWLTFHVSKRFRRYSSRMQQSIGDITRISEEVLKGQRMVKIFCAQWREAKNFLDANEHYRRMSMRNATTLAVSVPVTQIVAAFAVAGVISVALRDTGGGVMTPGELAAYFGAMIGMMAPIKRLTSVNARIQSGLAAASAIFDFLDEPGEVDRGTRELLQCRGHIQIENLSFYYPGTKTDVLRDIDVGIRPGETVAFVGRSGSGKSTLLSLLPRFYDADRGGIRLDGYPLAEYRLMALRSQISLVEQDVVLFNDTVARNIAYGSLGNADHAAIKDAAERAYAAEFVQALPNGYDTLVGQNGIMLSGGQRQRLAIARALLKDAPILILDEATSALDTESERAIQKGLGALMQSRTTLVIAHRLSTIQNADRIVVLHDGAVVEQGSHDELMDQGGHYRSLHNIQFAQPAQVSG